MQYSMECTWDQHEIMVETACNVYGISMKLHGNSLEFT